MTSNLAALYHEHLETLLQRAAIALECGGCEHHLLPRGTQHYHQFDDRDYPYAVNPQFKAWVPLTASPGSWQSITPSRRRTLIHRQPFDYWHAAPEPPAGYWP